MRIIISPAKKMVENTDDFEATALPQFVAESCTLLEVLKSKTDQELKDIWKCNQQIATLNIQRLQAMSPEKLQSLYSLTPAILAYEGIQYQYMAAGVFLQEEFDYITEHLRILSGFYGILKPFDGVLPYRLEMQSKLHSTVDNLYFFWGEKLAKTLEEETDFIVNLASKEYSKCILPNLSSKTKVVTCRFVEPVGEKLLEKGTMVKMARGEMVRFMAEENVQFPHQLKAFNRQEYAFSAEHSTDDTYTFIKKIHSI